MDAMELPSGSITNQLAISMFGIITHIFFRDMKAITYTLITKIPTDQLRKRERSILIKLEIILTQSKVANIEMIGFSVVARNGIFFRRFVSELLAIKHNTLDDPV